MMRNWWSKKPKTDGVPEIPTLPEANKIGVSKYLQAWSLLRKIPVQKLFPAVVSVSTVVFLAISGLVAWLVVFGSFIIKLLKALI